MNDLTKLNDAEFAALVADVAAEQARRAGLSPAAELTPVERAWRIASGDASLAASDEAIEAWGASNDYNSKGNGSTTVRRVLRGGTWQWFSDPASRGRFLASDRKDTKYGSVYEGEVLAWYTLGEKTPRPYHFGLVASDGKIIDLDHKAVKSGYRLSLDEVRTLDVSDPT